MSDIMEIEFEKNPKCEICKRQINTEKGFFMIRRKNKKDKYAHVDCYNENINKEINRVLNLGFDSWKNQLDKI